MTTENPKKGGHSIAARIEAFLQRQQAVNQSEAGEKTLIFTFFSLIGLIVLAIGLNFAGVAHDEKIKLFSIATVLIGGNFVRVMGASGVHGRKALIAVVLAAGIVFVGILALGR